MKAVPSLARAAGLNKGWGEFGADSCHCSWFGAAETHQTIACTPPPTRPTNKPTTQVELFTPRRHCTSADTSKSIVLTSCPNNTSDDKG